MTLNILNVAWPLLYDFAIESDFNKRKFANVYLHVHVFIAMETSLNGHRYWSLPAFKHGNIFAEDHLLE